MPTPRKTLPAWFETACIAGFCLTAALEWSRGETFWAYFFAIAAFVFSLTAYLNKRRG